MIPSWFTVLLHFCLLDQFFTDSAATVMRATEHQIVSSCHSVCEEEKAQSLNLSMKSKTCSLDLYNRYSTHNVFIFWRN